MNVAKPVNHIKAFVAAMSADSQFGQFADDMEKAFQAIDLEADGNDHAAALFAAVEWIVAQPKPVRDKLDVLHRLFDLSGFVRIPSIRAFAGW
jgi:Ca2+-binding EF-hand superfamily protein